MLAQAADQLNTGGLLAGLGILLVVYVAIIVLAIASMWKVFAKAGKPGWAAIVPIYNIVVWCEIVGRPTWWVILALIPGVNIVIAVILAVDLAKSFGKGTGFAVGLIFLGLIFWAILGFGPATYQGPSVPAAA